MLVAAAGPRRDAAPQALAPRGRAEERSAADDYTTLLQTML